MKKLLLTAALLWSYSLSGFGQGHSGGVWNGRSCAVVLTCDDTLNDHLENVIPSLDTAGLKGTFLVTARSNSLRTRLQDWRKASLNGHELGNHTLFHPCLGASRKRAWVESEYDLDN